MYATAEYADRAAQVVPPPDERDLYVRVQGEFREMPGLTLTLPQATRLFAIERARCERVLDALVDDGILATDGFTFACAHVGR
jgi:hypothetical protein